MFRFFWEDLKYLWNEDTFDNLFKLLAKKELVDYLQLMFRSRTAISIFEAMSYQYKFHFIEHLLQTKHDLIEEINQLVLQEQVTDMEEEMVIRKSSIEHFYMQVYNELSFQPYSLHFYLCFSKEIIK